MAVNTFDITAAEVAALIGHLTTIDGTTSPTSTEITKWISQISSVVSSALRSLGLDPADIASTATDADLELYHQCRDYITRYVAARWHAANRNGDTGLAQSYRIQFDEWLDNLTSSPYQATGADRGKRWRHPFSASNERATKWKRGRSYR